VRGLCAAGALSRACGLCAAGALSRAGGLCAAVSVAATRTIAIATALAIALAGCGGVKAPDLFIVYRSGAIPGAALTLLVNEEGGVRCNRGPTLKLSDSQLVQARAIQEDLHDPASSKETLPAGAGSVLSYYVRDENGTVRFSDDSRGQPKVFRQLALFVLQTAQGVCHLRM
jgi:hypothetical protein